MLQGGRLQGCTMPGGLHPGGSGTPPPSQFSCQRVLRPRTARQGTTERPTWSQLRSRASCSRRRRRSCRAGAPAGRAMSQPVHHRPSTRTRCGRGACPADTAGWRPHRWLAVHESTRSCTARTSLTRCSPCSWPSRRTPSTSAHRRRGYTASGTSCHLHRSPTAARDGVEGRKAGCGALLGGVSRFCGPHMMPEPMHRTGAVCHAAKHFDEARDAPFGAARPQPAASQPCRGWACPWAVRPSHGLLQLPLQARRRAWPPWAWGGGAACAPRMAEKLMKVSKRPSVGETETRRGKRRHSACIDRDR